LETVDIMNTSTNDSDAMTDEGGISEFIHELPFPWQVLLSLIFCVWFTFAVLVMWCCMRRRYRKEFEVNEQYLQETHSNGGHEIDDLQYVRIIQLLQQIVSGEWRSYLEIFKREQMTDDALTLIPCDPDDDTQQMWKVLVPPMGIRVSFKKEWNKEMNLKQSKFPKSSGDTAGRPQSERSEVELASTVPSYSRITMSTVTTSTTSRGSAASAVSAATVSRDSERALPQALCEGKQTAGKEVPIEGKETKKGVPNPPHHPQEVVAQPDQGYAIVYGDGKDMPMID